MFQPFPLPTINPSQGIEKFQRNYLFLKNTKKEMTHRSLIFLLYFLLSFLLRDTLIELNSYVGLEKYAWTVHILLLSAVLYFGLYAIKATLALRKHYPGI